MIRFPSELVDPEELGLPGSKEIHSKELELAKTLIKQLTGPWTPAKYTDEYQANLMKVIQAKLKGKATNLAGEPAEPRDVEVVDLMERLRQSLDRRGRAAPTKRRAPPTKRAAPARRVMRAGRARVA